MHVRLICAIKFYLLTYLMCDSGDTARSCYINNVLGYLTASVELMREALLFYTL